MAKAPPSTSRTRKTATPRSKTTTTAARSTATKSTKSSTAARSTSTSPEASRAATTTVAKAAPPITAPAPDATDQTSEEMRKRELFDAVVSRSGVKKRYAKPAVEAALAILGEALEDGRALQLPPLGKVKVQRSKQIDGGTVLSVRVRRKTAASDTDEESGKEGLAASAE